MRVLLLSVILAAALTSGSRQKTPPQEPPKPKAQGQFIVAGRDLPDPSFHDSVVLMLPFKEQGLLVGLIINKPLKLKLSNVFPDSPELQKNQAAAYFGGPVDFEAVARSAVFRSKTPPKNAIPVFGDVYVTFDSTEMATLAGDAQQASTLRVFLGRAQWDPGQFEGEVARGSWFSQPATADSVFNGFPESLWRALIDKADPSPVVQDRPPFVPLATVALIRDALLN
jgi:putative transcriptional regulator